jgi:hypothetical protein
MADSVIAGTKIHEASIATDSMSEEDFQKMTDVTEEDFQQATETKDDAPVAAQVVASEAVAVEAADNSNQPNTDSPEPAPSESSNKE